MLIQTYEGKTILEWALLAKEQHQRIAELEEEVAQWAEFKQRDVYQALVDARAEVARLTKAMDPIDQECCDLQEKWKAEAQWAAGIVGPLYQYILEMHATVCGTGEHPLKVQARMDIARAKRMLDGQL